MLSSHPHITGVEVKEVFLKDQAHKRLVVDTDLTMPRSGRIEENKKLLELHNYLEDVAVEQFSDFDEVEIRTSLPSSMNSFHGRSAA